MKAAARRAQPFLAVCSKKPFFDMHQAVFAIPGHTDAHLKDAAQVNRCDEAVKRFHNALRDLREHQPEARRNSGERVSQRRVMLRPSEVTNVAAKDDQRNLVHAVQTRGA